MSALDHRGLIHRFCACHRSGNVDQVAVLLALSFRETFFARFWTTGDECPYQEEPKVLVDGDEAVVYRRDGVERLHFTGGLIDSIERFLTAPNAEDAKASIRTVLEQREAGLEVKDTRLVDAKHAAPEDGLAAWFRTWDGPLEWKTRTSEIAVSGDVAYVVASERLTGTKRGGRSVDLPITTTLGLRKIGGEWKIAHEHQSVSGPDPRLPTQDPVATVPTYEDNFMHRDSDGGGGLDA